MVQSSSEGRSITGQGLFKGVARKKQDTKPDTSTAIQLGEHSRYQIKSGWLAGTFVARAFPKPPTKARGMIAEATGATEEEAIAALHDVIDRREDRRVDERRADPRTGVAVPSIGEYVEAIRQVALSRPQCAILTALSLAGEDGLAETSMADAAGYKSPASAKRSLMAAGLLIADYLASETHPHEPSSDLDGSALLGFRREMSDVEDAGNWILHDELREAVRLAF